MVRLYGRAFVRCTALEYVDFRSLTRINYSESDNGNFFFSGCTALRTIIVGESFDMSGAAHVFYHTEESRNARFYLSSSNGTVMYQEATAYPENLIDKSTVYYYSATSPTDTSKIYWHYDETGMAVFWNGNCMTTLTVLG